jgi:WD40 repeat protein
VFVLESHPSDPRVLLSAGHDGVVIVWDMLMGVCLQTITVVGDDENMAAIFDCKFSPDGLMCAAVDMNGYLSLMGFGSSVEYSKVRGTGGCSTR